MSVSWLWWNPAGTTKTEQKPPHKLWVTGRDLSMCANVYNGTNQDPDEPTSVFSFLIMQDMLRRKCKQPHLWLFSRFQSLTKLPPSKKKIKKCLHNRITQFYGDGSCSKQRCHGSGLECQNSERIVVIPQWGKEEKIRFIVSGKHVGSLNCLKQRLFQITIQVLVINGKQCWNISLFILASHINFRVNFLLYNIKHKH